MFSTIGEAVDIKKATLRVISYAILGFALYIFWSFTFSLILT
jgi:hypothetical protein